MVIVSPCPSTGVVSNCLKGNTPVITKRRGGPRMDRHGPFREQVLTLFTSGDFCRENTMSNRNTKEICFF